MDGLMESIQVKLLGTAEYQPYGDVVAIRPDYPFVLTNMGTAKRFNFMAGIENLRGSAAKLNLCQFRASPYKPPIEISLLERHQFSSQVFLPAGGGSFLSVVALGGSAPDLTTLQAFLVQSPAGVSYRPGVWHHPMIALDREMDFTCLVWEDGTDDDCHVHKLPRPISINISS